MIAIADLQVNVAHIEANARQIEQMIREEVNHRIHFFLDSNPVITSLSRGSFLFQTQTDPDHVLQKEGYFRMQTFSNFLEGFY